MTAAMSAELRLLAAESRGSLCAALDAAGLPSADIGRADGRFYEVRCEGRLVGFVGAEPLAPGEWLIRSLVVLPGCRGSGYGRLAVAAVLQRLAQEGARQAWALTTTAAALLTAEGFRVVARKDGSPGVRAAREFLDLCPSTATLMRRDLP